MTTVAITCTRYGTLNPNMVTKKNEKPKFCGPTTSVRARVAFRNRPPDRRDLEIKIREKLKHLEELDRHARGNG